MKSLLLCEGSNELAVINMLLDASRLIFSRFDLLGVQAFHARQLTDKQVYPYIKQYFGDIEVYGIGDKLADKLKIPKDIVNITMVQKVSTLPELEILLIISEGLTDEYEKAKSKLHQSPKEFCKTNIQFRRRRYDNSCSFYEEYYSGRVDLLTDAILRYHQLFGKYKKDCLDLSDLLKSN